jgi:hypothetical protein
MSSIENWSTSRSMQDSKYEHIRIHAQYICCGLKNLHADIWKIKVKFSGDPITSGWFFLMVKMLDKHSRGWGFYSPRSLAYSLFVLLVVITIYNMVYGEIFIIPSHAGLGIIPQPLPPHMKLSTN